MWYGSGTLNVAANSTNATGTGTQFLGNVRVGDGLAIQGSASLHEVTGVTSNTQLTFAPAFAGTAGAGKAFRVVPVLGYDKDLSDAFNALRLEFGDQLGNLQPWATAPTPDAAQTAMGMSTSGKAVASGTPAQGRGALGLGTAATRDVVVGPVDTTEGRVLVTGSFGVGGVSYQGGYIGPKANGFFYASPGDLVERGGLPELPPVLEGVSANIGGSAVNLQGSAVRSFTLWGTGHTQLRNRLFMISQDSGYTPTWVEFKHTGNTTVDSNGFLKNASPIIKVHRDRIELGEKAKEVEFTRIDTGHYQLSNTNGLRLDDGWYIETPHDKNGNKYFNVEWEQDSTPENEAGVLEEPADVTLSIRCYERVWNPQTGQYDNGDPVDIPDGRWIDLRMNEVRQPEPEEPEISEDPEAPQQPTEPTEPVIPSVVTMAQAKLALLYAGLYEQAEAFINDLPEPQRAAALIEWNHRQTLERAHPLVAQVAAALGLTEEQLDDLFVDAGWR